MFTNKLRFRKHLKGMSRGWLFVLVRAGHGGKICGEDRSLLGPDRYLHDISCCMGVYMTVVDYGTSTGPVSAPWSFAERN